jgi:N-methylhydantoinase B
MRNARGEIGVFNFGPDIETLRANCLAETGLPAPTPPQWAHMPAEALAEAAE